MRLDEGQLGRQTESDLWCLRVAVYVSWAMIVACIVLPPQDGESISALWASVVFWAWSTFLLSRESRSSRWRELKRPVRLLFLAGAVLVASNEFIDYVVIGKVLALPAREIVSWWSILSGASFVAMVCATLVVSLAVIVAAVVRNRAELAKPGT